MSDKRGTFKFSFDPDYDQDVSNPPVTLPNAHYEFSIDTSNGMEITSTEILYHFSHFLRSLGYVIDHDDSVFD